MCESNGQFVENLVEPAVLRLFQERGIDVQEVSRSMRSQRPGAEMEAAYDIYGAVAGIEIDEGVDRTHFPTILIEQSLEKPP